MDIQRRIQFIRTSINATEMSGALREEFDLLLDIVQELEQVAAYSELWVHTMEQLLVEKGVFREGEFAEELRKSHPVAALRWLMAKRIGDQ